MRLASFHFNAATGTLAPVPEMKDCRYQGDDVPEPPVEGRNIPDYWIRPPQVLSAPHGSS